MRSLLTALLMTGTLASSASAATFTDFASYDAAVNITLTEDFESLGTTTASFPGPWVGPSGITVSSQSNDLFTAGPGQSTNATSAIGSNSPESDTLSMALGGAYGAFGAEFFQNNGGGSQGVGPADFSISTYLGNILSETFLFSVNPNGGSFFGFTTLLLFDSVEITAIAGSLFEVADNVAAGDPGTPAVPLPAALPLLLMGIGAAAAARRVQKQ
jgi:hypothetical protein